MGKLWDYEYNDGECNATEERLDKVVVSSKDKLNWKIVSHPLSSVFKSAIEQTTDGKGMQRHGRDIPFLDQPWYEIANTHGIGFLSGQAEKKLREAMSNMGKSDNDWWEKEMLGAINYIAMAVLYRRDEK